MTVFLGLLDQFATVVAVSVHGLAGADIIIPVFFEHGHVVLVTGKNVRNGMQHRHGSFVLDEEFADEFGQEPGQRVVFGDVDVTGNHVPGFVQRTEHLSQGGAEDLGTLLVSVLEEQPGEAPGSRVG